MSNRGKADTTVAAFKQCLKAQDELGRFTKDQIDIPLRFALGPVARSGYIKKSKDGSYTITKEGIRYAKLQIW